MVEDACMSDDGVSEQDRAEIERIHALIIDLGKEDRLRAAQRAVWTLHAAAEHLAGELDEDEAVRLRDLTDEVGAVWSGAMRRRLNEHATGAGAGQESAGP
jgi:hypothetical protein